MKIAIISLGCPKNQVDADVFCHALIKDGHTTVADPAEADIIIINTCGFIESAKTEAIENILMACQYKQENPDLKVIVTGCLAERYKQQIIQEIPEVDAVVGIGSNAALPAIVRRVCADGAGQIENYGPKSDMQLGGARVISTPRHYAYLKIAEGCNNGCYYCAIPLIRGALRSREINDCVAEARWLAGEGVRELILVAQDPTAYGEDWGRPGAICELLDRLQEIDGIRWIRILYAYPERISDEFIAAMVRNTKVVPYLDLPIQHCDDAVLKAMNRRGGRKEIEDAIARLRAAIPGITLRTTLIAGFPGETEGSTPSCATSSRPSNLTALAALPTLPRKTPWRPAWKTSWTRKPSSAAPTTLWNCRPRSAPRARAKRSARRWSVSVTGWTMRPACTCCAPRPTARRSTAMC